MDIKIEVVKIMVEYQLAIMLIKNSVHHRRTKHINTHYHFIQDSIDGGRMVIKYVKTKDQLADILTKALGRINFLEHCNKMGVKKVWDEAINNEEHDGCDSSSFWTVRACEATVACGEDIDMRKWHKISHFYNNYQRGA